MNPSDDDIETSDSTSSSSFGPGPDEYTLRGEGPAVRSSLPRHAHALDRDEEGSSVERVRSSSTPPSYLRETGTGGGESRLEDARWRGSPCEASPEFGSEAEDKTSRMSTQSSAWHHVDRSLVATDRTIEYQGSTTRRSPGSKKDASSTRKRPLSAPPKTYPFARHQELPQEQPPSGEVEPRRATHGVGKAGTGDYARYSRGDAAFRRNGSSTEGPERAHGGRASGERGRSRTEEERLSLSSIFAAASERRTSEQKQPKTGRSLLMDGDRDEKTGMSDAARRHSQSEGDKEEQRSGGAILSSQEFGLRRWKEYAVLRHGTNQRFVNSRHGREILVETAATIRAKEVEDLNRELKEMRALVEELHSALRAEQTEKSNLQAKVLMLEREIEGMDFARRRWLKEDASNRARGSNLERRLAGNTGHLRMFLFGADAKSTTTKSTVSDASAPPASRSRPSMPKSLALGRTHAGTTSERPSAGEEDVGDAALNAATAEGNAVRRARETAELERSELRRRHDVEMAAKQSRIEKLKLEIRRLEAERDGLKQAAESQAGLFKDGYAELKSCLEEMKAYRQPAPPLPPTSDGSPICRRSQEMSLPTTRHHDRHLHQSETPPVSGPDSSPTKKSRAGSGKGLAVDSYDDAKTAGSYAGRGGAASVSEATTASRSSRRIVADGGGASRSRDNAASDKDDGSGSDSDSSSSCGAASEGSGTQWMRITPTDENSCSSCSSGEEDQEEGDGKSRRRSLEEHENGRRPSAAAGAVAGRRGREEILRGYLASSGPQELDKARPGIKRGIRQRGLLGAELAAAAAAAGNSSSGGGVARVGGSGPAGTRPRLLGDAEDEGQQGSQGWPLGSGGEKDDRKKREGGRAWGGGYLVPAASNSP